MKQHFRLSRNRIMAALVLGLVITLMTSCAPATGIQSTVRPMIISITPKDGQLFIQGRYFGTGAGGAEAGNYVLAGADSRGEGGYVLTADSWTATHITAQLPGNPELGFVFVVVGGTQSTGLPVNQR